jgi:hypothetical protein
MLGIFLTPVLFAVVERFVHRGGAAESAPHPPGAAAAPAVGGGV